jgi:hypothetical protein
MDLEILIITDSGSCSPHPATAHTADNHDHAQLRRAPKGLQTRGQALWRSTFGEFELAEHEQTLLLEACRTVDLLDLLQAQIDEDGVVLAGVITPPWLRPGSSASSSPVCWRRCVSRPMSLKINSSSSRGIVSSLVVGLVASMALGGSMRRRRVFPDLPPQHLLEFNAADWPQGMSGHRLSLERCRQGLS